MAAVTAWCVEDKSGTRVGEYPSYLEAREPIYDQIVAALGDNAGVRVFRKGNRGGAWIIDNVESLGRWVERYGQIGEYTVYVQYDEAGGEPEDHARRGRVPMSDRAHVASVVAWTGCPGVREFGRFGSLVALQQAVKAVPCKPRATFAVTFGRMPDGSPRYALGPLWRRARIFVQMRIALIFH